MAVIMIPRRSAADLSIGNSIRWRHCAAGPPIERCCCCTRAGESICGEDTTGSDGRELTGYASHKQKRLVATGVSPAFVFVVNNRQTDRSSAVGFDHGLFGDIKRRQGRDGQISVKAVIRILSIG